MACLRNGICWPINFKFTPAEFQLQLLIPFPHSHVRHSLLGRALGTLLPPSATLSKCSARLSAGHRSLPPCPAQPEVAQPEELPKHQQGKPHSTKKGKQTQQQHCSSPGYWNVINYLNLK